MFTIIDDLLLVVVVEWLPCAICCAVPMTKRNSAANETKRKEMKVEESGSGRKMESEWRAKENGRKM